MIGPINGKKIIIMPQINFEFLPLKSVFRISRIHQTGRNKIIRAMEIKRYSNP
jgi:hypothetical protein